MNNTEIIEIIESKKNNLKKIWYNVSDTNFEKLTNWFISIANSMVDENMNKIPNIKITDSFNLSYEFISRAIFDFNRVYNKLIRKKDVSAEDFKSERYNPFWYVFPKNDDTNTELENKRIINNCKFLIHQLDDHKIRNFWGHIEGIKEYIIKNNNILDSFNKWELTQVEEQMIMKLKDDNFKLRKKVNKKTILPEWVKDHEDYIMYKMWLNE